MHDEIKFLFRSKRRLLYSVSLKQFLNALLFDDTYA
jgi:hypothetical protein